MYKEKVRGEKNPFTFFIFNKDKKVFDIIFYCDINRITN